MTAEEDDPPPRLFAPAFWVALAVGLAFVLAGAAVAWIGPHWPKQQMPSAQGAGALTGPGARGKGAAPNTRNP